MKIHGVPQSSGLAKAIVFTVLAIALLAGSAVIAYYGFGECTRVHPVWYCLVR